MPNILLDLVPPFRAKVEAVLATCAGQGFELRPYASVRTPDAQARLWRQSRALEEIRAKIDELRAAGAFFLAACIERVGPQSGKHVTNAIPGLSWHQWGEAVDCFVAEAGVAIWDAKHPGYRAYAEAAKAEGLDAGLLWPKFRDPPHVQLRRLASPISGGAMTLAEVDAEMRKRWAS